MRLLIKRIFSSVTLLIGVVVVIGTFFGILFFLQAQQPTTYPVLVAVADIPAYSALTVDMIAVDNQMVHPSLLENLILEDQFPEFEGAVTLEPIYAGEQLTRIRLATGARAQALQRLSQALKDPNKSAMVLPVDAKSAPSRIVPGDTVNLVFSVGAMGIREQTIGVTLDPPGAGESTPDDPVVLSATLPASVVLLRGVPVLEVQHELIQNPAYYGGSLFGGEGEEAAQTESAYVKGAIESLTVLVDKEQQAVLAFALHNGDIDIAVTPAFAEDVELPGVSWTDFNWWYFTRNWGPPPTVLTPTVTSPVAPSLTVTSTMSGG